MVTGVAFSQQFGVPPDWFKKNSVLDVTLDIDTPLFIDPLLITKSTHREFAKCAGKAVKEHFESLLKLISKSKDRNDIAWHGAFNRLHFSERGFISGTCLGYSGSHTRGHGIGDVLANQILETAKEIIDLGVDDPDMFVLLPLFSEGIGPDLISDMMAHVSYNCIFSFSEEIMQKMEKDTGKNIPVTEWTLRDNSTVNLPTNPYDNHAKPVLLLPSDVLRNLPIVEDVRRLPEVAATSQGIRDQVSQHIGEIWKIRTKKDKEAIKRAALESKQAFETFLELVKLMEGKPYNVFKDPQGLIVWREAWKPYAAVGPLHLVLDKKAAEDRRINDVVLQILKHFEQLVTNQRMYRIFYDDNGNPRPEKYAQMVFQCVATQICNDNNVDVSPETDNGAGPIDFKFSRGTEKVLVEIKLSSNSKLVHGYDKQLKAYQNAEPLSKGHLLVLDVGKLGTKWKRLNEVAKADIDFKKLREIHLIDATPKPSASHI